VNLPRPRSRLHVVALIAVGALALFTVAGLVELWPDGREIAGPASGVLATESARVTGVSEECRTVRVVPTDPAPARCGRVEATITSGPDRGAATAFDLIGDIRISPGDDIRVNALNLPPDATVGGVPADAYAFADFERRSPLLWLTGIFAALVLITARWRGLRALAGLAASLALVALFIVPAILEGRSPVAVALVGSLAVMIVTITLGHGLGPKALASLLGTASALVLTLILAEVAVDLTHITGLASEDITFLQATAGEISVRGLLLAGILIAALGVLDDLTVSQSSTVMALRSANPGLHAPELFRRGLSVGHDHIVATVNTLVLAYVGASLPVLLIFSLADTSFSTAINSEVVASQVVATLVGSMGLIAAVPITTGLAALLAARLEPDELEGAAHPH
jgi:uncharacterized membrane protein